VAKKRQDMFQKKFFGKVKRFLLVINSTVFECEIRDLTVFDGPGKVQNVPPPIGWTHAVARNL